MADIPERNFHFDAAYYRRYYLHPATRVTDPKVRARLGAFVFAYLKHIDLPVDRVLDAGCGLGQWQKLVKKAFPEALYTGLEVSEYLCGKYGWTRASIADYKGRGRYDLIICQGVMQYLEDGEADSAIANLGRLCRGALYLEALTREDWDRNCDTQTTDGAVHLRPAAWYRKRLEPHFINLGGGLHLSHRSPTVLFELERVG